MMPKRLWLSCPLVDSRNLMQLHSPPLSPEPSWPALVLGLEPWSDPALGAWAGVDCWAGASEEAPVEASSPSLSPSPVVATGAALVEGDPLADPLPRFTVSPTVITLGSVICGLAASIWLSETPLLAAMPDRVLPGATV